MGTLSRLSFEYRHVVVRTLSLLSFEYRHVAVVVLDEIGEFAEDALRASHEISQSCFARLRLVPPLNRDKAISVDGESLLEQPGVSWLALVFLRAMACLMVFFQADEALALIHFGLPALRCCVPFFQAVGTLRVRLVPRGPRSSFTLRRTRLERLSAGNERSTRLPLRVALEDCCNIHGGACITESMQFFHGFFVE